MCFCYEDMESRYEESDLEGGSRLGLPKKWSKEGLKAVSLVTSEPPEKDYLKELEIVKENLKTAKLDMEEATVKAATTMLYMEESAYFWHLHMPSTNFVKMQDSEVQTENDESARRYRLSTAVQTFNPVNKKKMSQTAPIEMSTSCVFASEWDLYDTYRRLSYEDEEAELDYEDLDIEIYGAEVSLQRQSLTSEVSSLSVSNELQPIIASRKANIQANKVMKLPEFHYAVAVEGVRG
uniref:Uncharacterized protein n=1 Tax=Graphocephala atropunctata TaxID=36148 RepID=A0A1B6KLQ5_9HEMI